MFSGYKKVDLDASSLCKMVVFHLTIENWKSLWFYASFSPHPKNDYMIISINFEKREDDYSKEWEI